MRIVNTDNYGSDYPNEWFVDVPNIFDKNKAKAVAAALNDAYGPNHHRYYKVVENDYVLQPGFEP